LGQRSRKRGQRTKPAPGTVATAPKRSPAAPKRSPAAPKRSAPAAPKSAASAAPTAAPNRVSRSEERDAAVRARLKPLAPDERPWAVKIGALIALLVGGGDLIDVIVGGQLTIGRTHAGVGGVVLFSVLMLVCAVGMWKMRYWAVLGFQAILAIVILIFSLYLIRASNLLGFVVSTAIVVGGGFLFYKLVRALSRIQMPR
jgi:hypothetical protein